MMLHLDPVLSRRAFLGRLSGLGAIALCDLTQDKVASRPSPRARSVIYLNQTGAPSQFDTFEHKPLLLELHQKPVPKEYLAGQRFAFIAQGQQTSVLASP